MPYYTYKCEKGHEFEIEQPIKAAALTTCRHETGATDVGPVLCGATCDRLISKTSFKFIGGPPTPKHYT